jgi:PAB1-binding protein PBP1
MENSEQTNYLENLGKEIAKSFSKNSQDYKILFSENSKIGAIKIKIDAKRLLEIKDLEIFIKHFFFEKKFKIIDAESENNETFEIEKEDEKYEISVNYSNDELLVSISEKLEEFSLF